MKRLYGVLPDGREVFEYTIENSNGMIVKAINYGGIITSIIIPDREGNLGDVVLGYDSLDGYLADTHYLGAITGRCAGRIINSSFMIDGKVYKLTENCGNVHLHGGFFGFNKVYWDIQEAEYQLGKMLILSYESKDGEEGYPGNLKVNVRYILNAKNDLIITYSAICDKKTVVNLTSHQYLNLTAGKNNSALSHELHINALHFAEMNENLVTTGNMVSVKNTPFDFRNKKAIDRDIFADDSQLKIVSGYDHSFEIVKDKPKQLAYAAIFHDPESGRLVKISTTEPAIHIYSGNFLNDDVVGKNGQHYEKHSGIAFEAQHFPDSVHHNIFPSVILLPNERYSQTTVYEFVTI